MSQTSLYARVAQKIWGAVDSFTTDMLNADKQDMLQPQRGRKSSKSKLLSPEEEVKRLITSAGSLEDIWQFFLKRLQSGSSVDMFCLSVVDESEDFIRLRFLYPHHKGKAFDQPIISMAERGNHLVQSYRRKDTTFTANLADLGSEVTAYIGVDPKQFASMHIFSVPLIAGNRPVAMLTLGFSEVDAFSQAKLSYVYNLRDQVAQLVWNLMLQERMQSHTQLDNLTGLLSYTSFQRILEVELQRAEDQESPLTVMILDINNIQEVNTNLGHSVGDAAICHLASNVRRSIRGLDTVARYGGDEVVVVLPETDSKTAHNIAQRFIEGLHDRPLTQIPDFSISIGYATYPSDVPEKENLVKKAEQALHLAKFKGAKTGESTHIASHETENLNDKTVLEVFASQVAKKYNTHGPSIFQEIIRRIEHKEEGTIITPDNLMLETISSLAGALEAKDRYTRGHSQAVANYAVALAHALKMEAAEVEQIRLAAFLHDIGKIGIPESILCKPGPLDAKEWEIMRQHPVIGARQILSPVTALKEIIPMVEFHHENWDGTGHPMGLKGEDIPLGARIVSIVDAFHALTSDRSYRKAMTILEAKQVLEEGAGTKWDPNLTEVFFKILNIAAPKVAEAQPAMVSVDVMDDRD